jgi:tRNA pseudouridine65 synthase
MEAQRTDPRAMVLHRDDSLLAVDKPSGLLTHRGWGRDRVTLVDLVRELVGGGTVHPLHRLDRGASGVVLFALDREVAAALAAALARGAIVKRYLALVRGRPPVSGTIDHPIPRRPGGPAVPARTAFELLATAAVEPRDLSLVEAITSSGRLHQVRRHLKHLGHPLIGDANYGKGALNREIRARYGLQRLALHARAVELRHPLTGAALRIEAPLPDDLRGALERMGFPLEARGADQP